MGIQEQLSTMNLCDPPNSKQKNVAGKMAPNQVVKLTNSTIETLGQASKLQKSETNSPTTTSTLQY